MVGQRVRGIEGVLQGLLAPPVEQPTRIADQSRHDNPQGARLGRPPGKPSDAHSTKEKVTLRITSSLVAEYRDRSWEARSSFSGLVERAMVEYRLRFWK